ncbi:MAG: hypothetical protein ABSA02_02285 [Trebonia sp.]
MTGACQPSSRSELASCTAAWPPPTMSTPPDPGDPVDALLGWLPGVTAEPPY